MLIKAKQDYFDLQTRKNVLTGEVYEVSEERAKQICDAGFAEIITVKPRKARKKKEEE